MVARTTHMCLLQPNQSSAMSTDDTQHAIYTLQHPLQHFTSHVMRLTLLCCALSTVAAFVGPPGAATLTALRLAVEVGAGLGQDTLEELWRKPKKELLRIGQSGVTASHIRSLQDLVGHHTIVRVKCNSSGGGSYEELTKLGEQLVAVAGDGQAAQGRGLRLLGVRPSTKLLLVGDAEFVDGLPKGVAGAVSQQQEEGSVTPAAEQDDSEEAE